MKAIASRSPTVYQHGGAGGCHLHGCSTTTIGDLGSQSPKLFIVSLTNFLTEINL